MLLRSDAKTIFDQSADLREKDEILYLLDCARNAIKPSNTVSASGLPPLIALAISDALYALTNPAGFLYPAAWRWLLSRPVVDTDEVPLFYNVFYSTADDRTVELQWLLKTLQNGVQTSDVSFSGAQPSGPFSDPTFDRTGDWSDGDR